MAEHLPVYKPGQAITLQAAAALTGGQVVEVAGPGTVRPSTAASTSALGPVAFDSALNGAVTVFTGGVHELVATGAIAAGDRVSAAANGTVSTTESGPWLALTDAEGGAKARVFLG